MKHIFAETAICGRIAYAVTALEMYLAEYGESMDEWQMVLAALWSFSNETDMDSYSDRIIEFLPECILESNHYDNDWEYVSKEQFLQLHVLYSNCIHLADIQFIMKQIAEMVGVHLYSAIVPPARESLNILENRLLPFLKSKLRHLPEPDAFRIFSIHRDHGWDAQHTRAEIFPSYK